MLEKAKKHLPILLCGPTASGKSKLAMDYARKTGGIIINADALQIYDNWRVLTARPTQIEEDEVTHFLYGTVSIKEQYSVGHWLRDVKKILTNFNDTPIIIVGGTGLYFTSLINGLSEIPSIDSHLQAEIDNWHSSQGIEKLANWLETHDIKTFRKIDIRNPVRVLRAIEVLKQTGIGLSEWHKKKSKPLVEFREENSFVINIEISELNERISNRFHNMINNGALDEVTSNKSEWSKTLPGFQAIGAQQLFQYINNEITFDEATEQSIIRTRQYAQRQRTWFRNKMSDWTKIVN